MSAATGATAVVVAVDGVSGSGKSSTSKEVARRLGYRYLDTGAMYRAMTWWMLREGVDVHDKAAVTARVAEPRLAISTDPDAVTVTVDGRDVTTDIRTPEVTHAVSSVSAVPEVRARLVQLQRDAMTGGGIVLEGRDIGTVVAPGAEVKVYLVASTQVRAERRAADWAEHDVSVESTQVGLERRDALDSTREISPLLQADDAVEIDTTDLSLDEVVTQVVALVEQAAGGPDSGRVPSVKGSS